jgi:FKBP-type peptidyl-prolyl cis-trans isomerase
MEKVNKFLSEKDKDKIEAFLRRHDLPATFDELGFWFAQIESGNGEKIENGTLVALKCDISLLDGTPCYHYDEENPLVFIVNKSNELAADVTTQNVVSGLHSALLLMEKDERAILVFPPHLAHGIIGDGENVPPRSILVYDVKVLNIEK